VDKEKKEEEIIMNEILVGLVCTLVALLYAAGKALLTNDLAHFKIEIKGLVAGIQKSLKDMDTANYWHNEEHKNIKKKFKEMGE